MPEDLQQMGAEELENAMGVSREQAAMRLMKGLDDGVGRPQGFSGAIPSWVKELQPVKAYRPTPMGFQLSDGVIHRVHHDEGMVTVQFVPDQHRCRLPVSSLSPFAHWNATPEYPKVKLEPGEKVPSAGEIRRGNMNGNPKFSPLGEAAAEYQWEHANDEDVIIEEVQRWGLPVTTLEALRNRSVPAYQVTGEYNKHFYSNLYKSNFYQGNDATVSGTGHVGVEQDGAYGGRNFRAGGPRGGAGGGPGGGGGGRPGGSPRGGRGGPGGGGGPGDGDAPGAMGLGNDAGGPAYNFGDQAPAYIVGDDGAMSGDGLASLPDHSKTQGRNPDGSRYISVVHIPLEGPAMEQDLKSGRWYPVDEDDDN